LNSRKSLKTRKGSSIVLEFGQQSASSPFSVRKKSLKDSEELIKRLFLFAKGLMQLGEYPYIRLTSKRLSFLKEPRKSR